MEIIAGLIAGEYKKGFNVTDFMNDFSLNDDKLSVDVQDYLERKVV